MDVGLDWWDEGGQSLSAGLSLLSLLVLLPLLPAVQPSIIVLAPVQIDIEAPTDRTEPFLLQGVELLDGNTTGLGPRTVLERVVIKKLAAKEQADGQHSPDLTLGRLQRTSGGQHVRSLGEVVHAEKDCGAG